MSRAGRTAASRLIARSSLQNKMAPPKAALGSTPARRSQEAAPVGYSIDSSVGPMLRFEKSLPHLPVPTLVETTARWLESVKPMVDSTTGQSEDYHRVETLADDFLSAPVTRKLQDRLKERAKQHDNWLADWWNSAAYMAVRDPVVPGANYFYYHKDDKARRTGPKRAAALIRALLHFRTMVESEELEPEMVRQTPLAMASYRYLFNACRYPQPGEDTAEKFDPSKHQHVVAIRRNRFYEISVVDEKGDFLSAADLEAQFQKVYDMAGNENDPHPVGALTTANRDDWAAARKSMVANAKNAESLKRIESAIILVALDEISPVTREAVSWGLWVGDGKNRFFDKHQFVVFENGKSGFNGEHSCMDGTPTSRLNDWLLRVIAGKKVDLGAEEARSGLPQPKALTFELDSTAKQAISKAVSEHEALMAKHDLHVLHYTGFGKNLIKTWKTSPDSFAQLCMQLAYYKLTGKLAGTYESAQTRKFQRGRTEVIRSATAEALEWCRAMEDDKESDIRRVELLRRAVNAHLKYAASAADGKGVDRHFFGLKRLLQPGEELPALLTDPLFASSSHWTLSTSQLSSEFFDGWGYGEVVDDGFGLAYSVNNTTIRFTVTSMRPDLKAFVHYLAEACTETRETMEAVIPDEMGLGRSKL